MAPHTVLAARVLIGSMLAVMMFSLGLEIAAEPPKDKESKRRERRVLVRALFLNIVLMPLVAFAVVRTLHARGVVATAILIVAATPGGRFAPRVAKIARANLALTVEITLFLAKLTAFTAPLTVKWLLGVRRVELRDLSLVLLVLGLQIFPYFAGRQLGRARPTVRARLVHPLLLLEGAIGVVLLVLFLARGDLVDLRTAGAAEWGAGVAFASLSIGIGWLMGGSVREAQRAVASVTAARNLALSFLIASHLFRGGSVELALIGIWFICAAIDVCFAVVARAIHHAPSLPQLRPSS
jgi:BASS family bile acid:Na+ symporter